SHRLAFQANSVADALIKLSQPEEYNRYSARTRSNLIFLFPAQGMQFMGMGEEFYNKDTIFRAELSRIATIAREEYGLDILSSLYRSSTGSGEGYSSLGDRSLGRCALFGVEYALARSLNALGVEQVAMIGHGIGEFTAACLAGVMDVADALALV